jgi:hypothetical protein
MMDSISRNNSLTVLILVFCFIAIGCAASPLKYDETEVKQIPAAEPIESVRNYTPRAPYEINGWPVIRTTGFDASKNRKDKQKARRVFFGMTKEELRTHIGEPKEKYMCRSKYSDAKYELWAYRRDPILRIARPLFISLEKDVVYYNSHLFPSWAKCALMSK